MAGKKKRKQNQPKENGAVAKWPQPTNFQAVEQQVMQSVVNNYRGLLGQMDQVLQDFKKQVMGDMTRLVAEVPGLGDRLRVSDDGYEVMEPEPTDDDA